jgi:RimJ/RimL family protein N-acetyltransferase
MDGWKYMTKNAAVIPFSPGTAVYRDGMLSTLYYRSKELGRLEYIMCGENPSHDQFIRSFDESKRVTQILCEVENQGTPEEIVHPVGYAWVELPKGVDGERAALCGFAFIKRSRYMYDLGMLGIAYWTEGLKIDVIHGVLLEENKPAQRFAERLGFKHQGVVRRFHFYRGKLVSAVAMILEVNDFTPAFEKWFESKKLVATNA